MSSSFSQTNQECNIMRESTSSLTNNNTIYTEMALKTSIDTNNTKKALNLMTNIATWTFVDLAFIYRACLKKRHEKTGRNTQKYSFTRTKSASQCLSSSPLPQRKEPNQKIKKFLTWPWTAVIQRILWWLLGLTDTDRVWSHRNVNNSAICTIPKSIKSWPWLIGRGQIEVLQVL